ncbi:PadR family transcriptional regulator [Domibacillus enclensis]|uniref:PadR family transcriptional regulator n=1 Tax=Domibacillus enclensis TaxID=1017273 RepID=A0A1N7AEA9_9BACI|nr:PadR family transcriptional regulator [Domibacillus enclensis]OXS75793.1 PadR family transcriptional regulator [Domibacillus enclensis]SIR37467.1 Transcriptional regulator PadR-like family protein [Domibacillus enclensis]
MARQDALESGELTDTSYYILLSLVEARHGYLIMKTIEELTDRQVAIGPASMYTTIKKLLKAELIEQLGEDQDKKKTYIATQKGLNLLKKDIQRREKMIQHARGILKWEGDESK